MGFLWSLFSRPRRESSDIAYQKAMGVSDDLIRRMRENSTSSDAARAVMADIWAQHHNIPFMTSVYETVQELNASTRQRPMARE